MERSEIRGLLRRTTCPGLRCAPSGLRELPGLFRPSVNRPSRKYSTLPKFGNIVCVAHPGSPRGAIVCRAAREPGCGGRGSVGRERRGQGGLLSVSPRLRADEQRCQVRLACKFPAPSTGLEKLRQASEPCVRQNRVVLAVVATVKPWRMRQSRQPARRRRISRRRGRPEGTRLPGEHGISRQPTAQGRPSDWLHLYAAVRFPLRYLSRSGPRVPAGTRPSLRPLGQEGGATKQSSGEMRRENAKACLKVENAEVDEASQTPKPPP